MGLLGKIIGLLIAAGGVILFAYSSTITGDFIMSFIGMFCMALGLSLITGSRNPPKVKPPPPTVTEIRCDNIECDFKEIRDFQKGDYIFKPVEATCPKCTGTMQILGVYIVREEPKDKDQF